MIMSNSLLFKLSLELIIDMNTSTKKSTDYIQLKLDIGIIHLYTMSAKSTCTEKYFLQKLYLKKKHYLAGNDLSN